MKLGTFLLIGLLVEISCAPQVARAGFPPPINVPRALNTPYNNLGGPKLTDDPLQTPSSADDPYDLISDDSTNSLNEVPGVQLESSNSFGMGNVFSPGKKSDSEGSKPIEKVQTRGDSPLYDESAPVPAAPAPKRETKRILLIALGSVALLAFRKFRRPAGMPPQKPSFL